MKYVDVIIQTLILIAGAAWLMFSIHDSDWLFIILITQLILGPWQFLSSLLSILTKSDFWRKKGLHFTLSSFYLTALFVGANFTGTGPSALAIKLMLTIPAWSLAIFYYVLTWRCTLSGRKKRGSFLPNLSF